MWKATLMRNVSRVLAGLLADESGATAVEYGLICSGIALAILTLLNALGTSIVALFNTLQTTLS